MIGTAHAGSHNWTGLYAGADAGVVFNDAQLTSQHLAFTSLSGTCDLNLDFTTFSSGIQLGYMYQFGSSVVAGVEVNTTFNGNQKQTSSCRSEFNPDVYDSFTLRNQTQTAIKGRVGRALNWDKTTFLPYLAVGASLANLELSYNNEGGNHQSTADTAVGWLIGAGMEWSFLQHWSLRAEYSFADYGDAINLSLPVVYGLFDTNGEGQVNLKSNTVLVSINYWIF